MNTIKQRAHQYAQEHYMKNGVSLMRAYIAGAESEQKLYEEERRLSEAARKYLYAHSRVFLSGKISGLEYYVAYQNFSNAERKLSAQGYRVINPMKICKKRWSWVRCMIKCLWTILWCDKIYQLPNWQESRGARIEYKWGKFLRKKFIT